MSADQNRRSLRSPIPGQGGPGLVRDGSLQDGGLQDGDAQDWAAAGWEKLRERFYLDAVRCFGEYLNRAQVTDGAAGQADRQRRAEVHVAAAVARLGAAPPGYRAAPEIAEIVNHLLAARATRLAPVIAALVKEDYHDSAGTSPFAALARIAERATVERLTRTDLDLLAGHVAPTAGPTWARVCSHAAQAGVTVERYQTGEDPPPDDDRRLGVHRYFLPTPRPPRRHRIGGGAARIYRSYRRSYERFRRSCEEAEPKPTDARLDDWLRQDVDRIVALGARRHRLNLLPLERGGDLLIEPQVVVGVSRRSYTKIESRTVPDAAQPSGFAVAQRQSIVPVARSRAGDDGQLRADNYHLLAVYSTRHRICVFECELELATRHMVGGTARTFHYEDVAGARSKTVVDPKQLPDTVTVLFDDGSGSYEPVLVDDRVVLSVVEGDPTAVGIGFSGRTTGGPSRQVAWANQQALGAIDRLVRSRRGTGSR